MEQVMLSYTTTIKLGMDYSMYKILWTITKISFGNYAAKWNKMHECEWKPTAKVLQN